MSAGLVTTYRNILTKAQLEVILATMQDEIDGLVAIGMAQINKHDRVNGGGPPTREQYLELMMTYNKYVPRQKLFQKMQREKQRRIDEGRW